MKLYERLIAQKKGGVVSQVNVADFSIITPHALLFICTLYPHLCVLLSVTCLLLIQEQKV